MPMLDDTAVEEGLQHLPGWERRGNEIVKTFVRKNLVNAITFVNEVADAAEAAGHHPNIDIRWNKVTLALSSYAEGGLTENDFQLGRPHPGVGRARAARLTDRRARIEALDPPRGCRLGAPRPGLSRQFRRASG